MACIRSIVEAYLASTEVGDSDQLRRRLAYELNAEQDIEVLPALPATEYDSYIGAVISNARRGRRHRPSPQR